ncbi:bifunctional methylenetetrahydrofolate dehydrogenase/methenyltetrahydrofolate cyclohydrolase FolD [Peribacillus deserti]|uniref:Bifunctional protein FolD n=1 Tax=Peribacillus deserti TaxID=673318 RepID=A0A2N5M456_9BACI|nr:bifunctional methylenetetrahydrofolate dehydrogenase/methenyltetrahydrofolate cyclohydrolase FolD [Peribacillus deserti]PLT29148.1 bifunctional methylenetetrahydrofolate dehydrogenase/methenyltetrahydrofolate cyclohydrolase FolD [Peribacillus deserti]
MTAAIINGKEIAADIRKEIKAEVESLKEQNLIPGLAVILVGNNQASRTYVTMKEKACKELGIHSVMVELPDTVSKESLIEQIQHLNEDSEIHGILVQLPLPGHINETEIIEAISPDKDVDGFHPVSIGRLMTGQDTFYPCTPYGIIKMVEAINVNPEGKHVVVVGRSNIVGKPVGQLFLNLHATVTYCHSKTADLEYHTKQADILIAAAGRENLIGPRHVKEGAVVIDVAMNRNSEGKLCGDVAFDEVKEIASYITPVPGGVGPMTITMLLFNTVKSLKLMNKNNL